MLLNSINFNGFNGLFWFLALMQDDDDDDEWRWLTPSSQRLSARRFPPGFDHERQPFVCHRRVAQNNVTQRPLWECLRRLSVWLDRFFLYAVCLLFSQCIPTCAYCCISCAWLKVAQDNPTFGAWHADQSYTSFLFKIELFHFQCIPIITRYFSHWDCASLACSHVCYRNIEAHN